MSLDFVVRGDKQCSYFEIKTLVGLDALTRLNSFKFKTLEDMAYSIGRKLMEQKHRFVDAVGGPASAKNVGHLIDLYYVPPHQKAIVIEYVLKGAMDAGSLDGIFFMNE